MAPLISIRLTPYTITKTILLPIITTAMLSGCQHFQNAESPSRGHGVSVSMTVKTDPTPPSAQPIQATQPVATPQKSANAKRPIDERLLPKSIEPTRSLTESARHDSTEAGNGRSRSAILKADVILTNRTITEDMALRGSVLVRGSLVVAPHATLRIEPGTVIRFSPALPSVQKARLVVQGRIICNGLPGRQITLTSVFDEPIPGDWGGIMLVSSEKKNSFEHCRIEGAESGIEARYSSFSAKSSVISRSITGITLNDSTATLSNVEASRCNIGIWSSDSELELRDALLKENRTGLEIDKGSFTITASSIRNNSQDGIIANSSRFRISTSTFAENRTGATFSGANGQISLSRFFKNRGNGLISFNSRIRITSSTIQTNSQTGLLLEDTKGSVTGSNILENGASNIIANGKTSFAAVLNWWGTANEADISSKIQGTASENAERSVPFHPYLNSKPAGSP